jgi:NADPH-dependent ferric siderophore reductase
VAPTAATTTPLLRRPFPLHAGVAEVVGVAAPTPGTIRVTLAAPAFADLGVTQPGEILTLGWAAHGETLVLPKRGWRFPPGTREQHWRNYTVRHYDPARAQLDVDFALHEDPGEATRWATVAAPGDRVGYAGPRMHWGAELDADWSLLVADDTALPALLAIVESLPTGHPVIAVAEVADHRERQDVDTDADLALHWVTRDGRRPGTTSLLVDAVRALELPPGLGRAWGGGESLAMRDVRTHLRGACGMPAGAVHLMGYWRHRSTPEDVDFD